MSLTMNGVLRGNRLDEADRPHSCRILDNRALLWLYRGPIAGAAS